MCLHYIFKDSYLNNVWDKQRKLGCLNKETKNNRTYQHLTWNSLKIWNKVLFIDHNSLILIQFLQNYVCKINVQVKDEAFMLCGKFFPTFHTFKILWWDNSTAFMNLFRYPLWESCKFQMRGCYLFRNKRFIK